MKLTLCGSIAFYTQMEVLKEELESIGHEVRMPQLDKEAEMEFGGERKINFDAYITEHGGIDAFAPDHAIWDVKREAINDHFRKIEWAEAIVVANFEKRGIAGYIGGNTLIEIGLAFYLHKGIYVLNPVSSEISYKQEIYGMGAVLLDGELSKINH